MIIKLCRRLVCLLLVLLVLGTLVPAGAFAEGVDTQEPAPEEVEAQLSRMYNQVLEVTQKESLNGLCATLVTWELYIKRINRQFVSGDGKDQFDNYRDMEVTTGGYYVHPLSAEDYTLEEALLIITNNGTRNAYNILIGFEKTRSAAGSLYGHTVFIGAIIDGTVYYVESNDYTVGGVVYKEGTPISCSISQFAAEYANWATFEGAVEFSQNRYLDLCQVYPTDLYVQTGADTVLRTEPCFPEDSIWSYEVRSVREKEIFHVNALVCDTLGRYWYRMAGEQELYFPAEETNVLYSGFDSVSVSEVRAPEVLKAGKRFEPAGIVASAGSKLRIVRSQIYSGDADAKTLVDSASWSVESQACDLGEDALRGQLRFRELESGEYRYVVSAVVRNSFLEEGELVHCWDVVVLWNSEFLVCEDPEEVSEEPEDFDDDAERPEAEEDLEGWHLTDGLWRFYEDGEAFAGLLKWDGIAYYIHEDGTLHTGWLETDDASYYFFENGAAASGLMTVDGEAYFFDNNGAATEMWMMSLPLQVTEGNYGLSKP